MRLQRKISSRRLPASCCDSPNATASSSRFCRGDIAAVVGIRKIGPEGVVLSGGLIAKVPQPDPFHLVHSQISVDHQRSRLKP